MSFCADTVELGLKLALFSPRKALNLLLST